MKIYRGNGRVEWVGDPNNKIRISAPPLKDLGFEEDEESMVPVTAEPATEAAADPSNSEPKREEENSKKPNRSKNN